jgi:NADPH:quinone reductase-like Zn-dependent oxidoreductase
LVTIVVREPSKELIERHGIQAAWVFVHPSRPDLEHLSNLVMSGQLRSHVSQTFPLERVADAHRSLETGRTVGKIVLEVA